jgi:hypothetical protein
MGIIKCEDHLFIRPQKKMGSGVQVVRNQSQLAEETFKTFICRHVKTILEYNPTPITKGEHQFYTSADEFIKTRDPISYSLYKGEAHVADFNGKEIVPIDINTQSTIYIEEIKLHEPTSDLSPDFNM